MRAFRLRSRKALFGVVTNPSHGAYYGNALAVETRSFSIYEPKTFLSGEKANLAMKSWNADSRMSTGQIFISYRREDSGGYTRAIYDQLVKRFSKSRIFMDVDAIDPGLPFDEVIDQAVSHCEVLLAMIGKRWMEPEVGGVARINNPKDFVRLEITAALSRSIRVIPVLLDGAMMPSEDVLPEPLRPFARRNAIEVSNSRFNSDVEILVAAVGKALGEPSPRDSSISSSRRSMLYWVLGALALGGVVPVVRLVNRWMRGEPQLLDSVEADWRFCGKCLSMFYDGHATKGVCPAGGAHVGQGYNFVLPHDAPSAGQPDWRICQKCYAMFFDGYPTKGVCPAGSAHVARGYNFILPHDKSGPGQTDWRFCQKCQAMFFDGYPNKGVCPAGGAHNAAGLVFVLPYA